MGKRGRVAAAGLALVVLAALAFTGYRVWRDHDRTDLSRALDVVPAATKRVSFTDWTAVRKAVKADLGPKSDRAAVEAMISKAYDADLSAVSSIDESAGALQEKFGFSPASIEWEAFAQSDTGATMVVRMPDDFDLGVVRDHLDDLGYTKPASKDGVWLGGIDLVAQIDPTITPELQYVAVLADQHLIVTSDTESYAKTAVKVAEGDARSLGDVPDARAVVAPMKEPAAAMIWPRDFACSDLSMSQGDDGTGEQADALVAAAGKITPLSGLVMALGSDRALQVSQLFESDDEAKVNLTSRAKLAVGEALGRGGSFSDDFKLTSSKTDGRTVQLRLTPRAKTGYVLSALDSGPVLFATC